MGRVAGSYGVRGWLKVLPDAGAAQSLVGASEWWIGDEAFKVNAAKVHGATVLGELEGIGSPEAARALKGEPVAVRREALPELEEGRYYLADLLGLEVVNESGTPLGVVTRTYSNGAQDVIEVTGERTRLIPWVAAVVKGVDLAGRRIEVEWGADW